MPRSRSLQTLLESVSGTKSENPAAVATEKLEAKNVQLSPLEDTEVLGEKVTETIDLFTSTGKTKELIDNSSSKVLKKAAKLFNIGQ